MEIDWLKLWGELVSGGRPPSISRLAKRYQTSSSKGNKKPDQLLDFILKEIDADTTVIDIGAGTGRWTIPLAQKARLVTVVEPSTTMLKNLKKNISAAKLKNIHIIQTTWEDANVKPHHIIACAHGMYSSPDLAYFVHKMEKYTLRTCYLALRLPPADGIIGELSLAIYGRRHDSPNAIIAYNALYSMGIYTNVLVENTIYNWTDKTLKDAFYRAKRHLNLETINVYDHLIKETLAKRLRKTNDGYIWPDGMRSALLWWKP